MMNKKMLSIFVMTLMIATIVAIPTSSTYFEKTGEIDSGFSVHMLDLAGKDFCVERYKSENTFKPVIVSLKTDSQVTSSSYDEIHPSVATDSMGNYLIAYEQIEDGVEEDIYASVSTNFGETWSDIGFFYLGDTLETYPSFDYANNIFYGTFTPDPTDDQGGI